MPLFGHPTVVRSYFGYRSAERLVLTARALRMLEPRWERTRILGKIAAIVSQFAASEVADLSVTLEFAAEGREPLGYTQVSDKHGYLCFDLTFPSRWDLPEDPAWQVALLRWNNQEGPQTVKAYVLAPGRTGKLAVISDIDDTILETGAGRLIRNWRRVVAQMPSERVVVPGAVEFYQPGDEVRLSVTGGAEVRRCLG
jgi:phosphatidate phosphatase APP1